MWLLLSLGTAVFTGTSDAFSKHLVEKHHSSFAAFAKAASASLFLLPFLALSQPPSDPLTFWKTLAVAIPLEVGAALLFQKALQLAPLSQAMPFLAFTPVFLLGLGWIFLKESVGALGMVGVLCVAGGAFLVMSGPGDLFSFLKMGQAGASKGPILMLIVSFIYAITSVLAKKALLVSSPLFFSSTYYPLIAAGLFPFLKNKSGWARECLSEGTYILGLGACEALSFLLQFHAFLYAETAYIISVKRLSLLVALAYGYAFFHEERHFAKTAGAVVMICGAALIAFAR